MKKEEVQKVMLLMDLPIEIVAEIFSKLPVDNIVRCQLVCKKWNKMINQSCFRDLYVGNVARRPRRIMLYDWEINEPLWINLEFDKDTGTVIARREDRPREKDFEKFSMRGFSNGMFFMAGLDLNIYSTVRMCNPLTGDCIQLPGSGLRIPNSGSFGHGFGFGFDHVNEKYKVIHIYVSGSGYDCYTLGEIITLGENSWRPIEFPVSVKKSRPKPLFSNGELYWLIKGRSAPWCLERVLIFDIVSETFETAIILPEYLEESEFVELVNFGESAALMESYMYDTDLFQVWLIVGNRSEGRRLHYVEYDVSDVCRRFMGHVHFVALLSDGTIVFKGSCWRNEQHYECNFECYHIALYFPLTKTGLVIADEIYFCGSVAQTCLVNPSSMLG